MEPILDLRFALTLDGVGPQLLDYAAAALFEEAELIMGESKEIAPFDEGVLAGSGHVELPERKDGEIRVTLAYGGPAEAYAIEQHENLALHHPNGRQAKYLERPLIAHADSIAADVAARIRAKAGL